MEKAERLRNLLEKIVEENPAQGILFSAGLDTSILASLLPKKSLPAITVAVGKNPPDLGYAKKLSEKFSFKHFVIKTDYKKLMKEMPDTIRILKSFDPMTLRNNVVIYLALKKAKSLKLKSVMTGDGGDELFAGYKFIFEKKPRALLYSLRKMWKIMHFASHPIGAHLGMKVISPYLDKRVQQFAKNLSAGELVEEVNGSKIGKAILRRAFEKELPKEFVWRVKTPIQDGSGSAGLTQYFEKEISDKELRKAQRKILQEDQVNIRNKEQLAYYQIYRKIFGKVKPKPQQKKFPLCPDCGASVIPPQGKFCRTCGLWPAC